MSLSLFVSEVKVRGSEGVGCSWLSVVWFW